MAEEPDDTLFSRTAHPQLFGKLDDKIPEIRIDGDTRIALDRLARSEGFPDATSFVRMMVYVRVYGVEHVCSVQNQLIKRAIVNAPPMSGDGGKA